MPPNGSAPPSTSHAPDPLLVRLGIRYFQALSSEATRRQSADAVHVLNDEERKALRRIERGAILRAAIAGAVSSAIAAAIELHVAGPLLGPRPRYATFEDQVRFYAVLGAATVVTAAVEIAFLYWDGLRAVHRLSHEAGLDLFPQHDGDKALAGAMARAALELPNPTNRFFGVDPRREASRVRLVLATIVYKAKISVTNFLVKAIVRRVLGRAFVRSWLPFVAVPVTAAWNAVVCRLIMREARIRAMGPSAARELVALVLPEDIRLSREGRAVVVRAVASSIVRTEDLHPNLAALFLEVIRRIGGADIAGEADLDDTALFLERIARLDGDEQAVVLRVLAVASTIDGRLTLREKRLLAEAHAACGRQHDIRTVERLRRAFVKGESIAPSQIASL
jgi:hypothetical protein